MKHLRQTYLNIRTFPRAFWVVIIATLMNQIGNMAVVFLLLYLNDYLRFTLTHASFAFAVFSAAMIGSGLYGGSLVDLFGSPRVMAASLILNGCILSFFPFVHNYFSILLFCLIWGLTYGLNRPSSQVFISELTPKGMSKLGFSLYRLVLNLGMSIGPAVGGYLAGYSFPLIFTVNGMTNLVASVILIGGLLSGSWFKKRKVEQQQFELNLKWLKKDKTLRLFVMGMIPISMVFFQHESTLAIFIENNLNFPISFYGWLFTLNTLIIVFFELPLNVLTMDWPYRINFILGSLFITLGFSCLMFASTKWHIILLAVCWTLGEMLFYPSATSYIADIAPTHRRGSYMSLYSMCSNIGMLFGPWGGAILMQHFGANSLWIACGIMGVIAMGVFTRTPNINQR